MESIFVFTLFLHLSQNILSKPISNGEVTIFFKATDDTKTNDNHSDKLKNSSLSPVLTMFIIKFND